MNVQTQLCAPFDPNKVSWRVGSTNKKKWEADRNIQKKGMPLAYIDARDVMNRLDEVCGVGGWSDRYEDFKGRLICVLSIKIGDEWVSKSDGADDTDVEGAKGGISDAFKRAAVKWGVGRYLYDVHAGWVELDDFWNIKPETKTKLNQSLLVASGKQSVPRIETISNEQRNELQELLTMAGIDVETYCKGKKIESLMHLTIPMFEESKKRLSKSAA